MILADTFLSLGSHWNSFPAPALTWHCRSTEQCMVPSNYKFPSPLTDPMDLSHSLKGTSSAASPRTSRHFLADSSLSGHKNTMLPCPETEILNMKGKSRVRDNSCVPFFSYSSTKSGVQAQGSLIVRQCSNQAETQD